MPRPIPEKPALEGLEANWSAAWETQGTYRFDRDAAFAAGKHAVYGIDTPPPTASGSLHIGHVFSYTHMDLAARYHRMRGEHLFFPMGWDDNGLPTERRVQNYYGVRVDTSVPYDPDFTPPQQGGEGKSGKLADQVPVSRRNFIELCERLTEEDEEKFEEVWRALGLSVDWTLTYRTIGPEAQRVSQRAFLRNLARGEAYQAEAPTVWDVTFQSAVAQAEIEDKDDQPGAFHTVAFHRPDGGTILVDTTRPELIAADVALVAHPDDERFKPLFGTTVTTPVFGAEIPVLPHRLAQPDKGTGIAMVSTWGDVTDVVWWRELQLPARAVVGKDGRFLAEPGALEAFTDEGRTAYGELAGKTVFSARARMVELLKESGDLIGDARPIKHTVKFFEKGDKPLEIVSTKQWYIANGARDEALKATMLERGQEIAFHPEHMRVRYENWIGGLNGDWLVSRQRFFGVPLPVWYRLGADGERTGEVLVPSEDRLPIDPSSDAPDGYDEAQRDVPGGFEGEVDIMDTWATSSLTPQIAGGWGTDDELFDLVFPYRLRSQGQDIIRTWLFSTALRSQLEHGSVPWTNAGISGFIVDPDRKKMSKSKGNVVTPAAMLEQHGSDAVRYWAASSRLGIDAPFDPQNPTVMKIGRRLAIKILNAANFVLQFPWSGEGEVTELVDRDMLAQLGAVVKRATAAFEAYDHSQALEATESFFWTFCDDYLELVKERAHAGSGQPQVSAVAALRRAIDVLVRLFAPFLPFATEEVWSWMHDDSVHRAAWPTAHDASIEAPNGALGFASDVLTRIRGAKTAAKLSMKAPIASATLVGIGEDYRSVIADIAAVGRIEQAGFVLGTENGVRDIVLAEAV